MEGYKHLDWYAYHAWRHWQGTLSGKCGITFENDQCGESVRGFFPAQACDACGEKLAGVG